MVFGMDGVSPLVQALVVAAVVTVIMTIGQWLASIRSYFAYFNSLPGETDFSCIWGNLHKAISFAITSGPKPWNYDLMAPWLGRGLLVSGGAKWARSRRLLTPAFHFDILKPYVAVKKHRLYKDDIQVKGEREERREMMLMMMMMMMMIHEKEGPPKKRYLDFLDILLTAKDDSGQGMTPLDIRNEVDTFMFAGHDTTSSAISWTLYSLCEHPEYQQRVQEEVDHILQGRQSDDIQWSDLSRFEFLTFGSEGSHASPFSCAHHLPTSDRTPLQIEDITLPADTHVNVKHLQPAPQPGSVVGPVHFPARAVPPRTTCRTWTPYAFLPFSAGPRNCIGQHFAMNEAKIVLARLLRRFSFSLDPDHKVERAMAMVMQTENGIKMFVTNRTHTV
nr:hypothetical protein BaRGS_013678 [Batillaria attramentaria]